MSLQQIGIIGAGQMGAGIAQVAAQAGLAVVMHDIASDMCKRGVDGIARNLDRMIDHIRLLIAVDDEAIPVKKKLEAQAILKDFQSMLAEAPENQERGRIKGYYEILCRDLGDEADVAALLSSLKNYIPYL